MDFITRTAGLPVVDCPCGQGRPPPVPQLCGREKFREKAEQLEAGFYTTGPPGGENVTARFTDARLEAAYRKDMRKT